MQTPMSSFLCKSSGDPNSGPPAYRTGSLLIKIIPRTLFLFLGIFCCLCICMLVCVCCGGSGYGYIEAKVNLELINSANLAGQGALESTWGCLDCTPRVQVYSIMLSFLYRHIGIELRSSCLPSKYFTNISIFQAYLLIFGARTPCSAQAGLNDTIFY